MEDAGIEEFIAPLYKGLDTFNREMVGFIPSVTIDAQAARVAKGDVIKSPIATAGSIQDLEEAEWSGYHPTDDGTVENVSFTIENQKVIRISLEGEQTRSLDNSGTYDMILEGKIQDAFRQFANSLETYIAKKAISGASRAVGTAGTTPFGTAGDMSDFANLAQVLDDNGCPQEGRNLVLSSTAMANMRGKQTILLKTNEAGTDEFLRSGYTTPIIGFKLWSSAGLKTHKQGTGSGYLVNGVMKKGTHSITVDSGSGIINEGDVVSFDKDSNLYIVNSSLESGGTNLEIGRPGIVLEDGLADNTAITVGNTDYIPSVAFQKNAIILGTRMLSDPRGGDGSVDKYTLTDPLTNISFDVRLYRMYHKAWLEIGLAYGAKVVKSDNVAVLLG